MAFKQKIDEITKFYLVQNLKDFVHYIKPTLQEKEFETSILHMGVINVLKLSSNIDNVLSM